jgi:hypothetical protein
MKPSDKKKPATPAPKAKQRAGEKPQSTSPIRFSAIVFNVVAAVVSAIFLTSFFQHHEPDPANPTETHLNSGYDWLYNSMLKGNLETIEKNPDKTVQEKYIMKWGPGEILYVDQIKKTVPDTATIVLPPKKLFKEVGFVMTQTGPIVQRLDQQGCKAFSMVDAPWITYFLYPRRVLYADSVATAPLPANARYLVSIGGWGLDKVGYAVDKPEAFMVLPIKK